jgi:NAD(P)H-quinone oxidoreductase subunit 5
METVSNLSPLITFAAPLIASLAGLAGLERNHSRMREYSFFASVLSLLAAVILAYTVFSSGPIDQIYALVGNPNGFHFTLGFWIDSLSSVLLLLITSIGLVVQRYSMRYLDGDKNQGRFFSWLSFVIASVCLFVMSRNLLALTLAWFLVSFGVHRLLLHFPAREAAQKAAWRKFVISRIGDLMLLLALVLTYAIFHTFELKDLFRVALESDGSTSLSILGTLYVLGAMTKSAQFPFHIWLPDTMETPTPVSALMHAGIINAGGFLIVRLNPIVSHADLALHVLLVVGALTTLFAGMVILVQTDVKRSLAYSTIGQMGYMMMQCGVGAYAAGVLHLVMHGFYKAYAFLSAGGGVAQNHFATKKHESTTALGYALGGALSLLLVVASVNLLGIDLEQKAGGWFLCLFLWASATQALARAFATGTTWITKLVTLTVSFVGMLTYWGLLTGFDSLLGPAIDHTNLHYVSPWVVISIGALFFVSFVVTEIARSSTREAWADRLYVLCLNHFYVEYAWRATVQFFLGKTSVMPGFENTALGTSTRKEI